MATKPTAAQKAAANKTKPTKSTAQQGRLSAQVRTSAGGLNKSGRG